MTRFVIECGKGIAFGITDEMLLELGKHQSAFDHVLMIGLKNMVQDSHAGVKREDFETEDDWRAESKRVAELKLGSILAGDIRKTSGTRAPKLSDRDAFTRKFMVAKLKAAFVAKHGKDNWKAKTEGDEGAAFIAGLVEKNAPKFEAEIATAWEAELAARKREAELAGSLELDI